MGLGLRVASSTELVSYVASETRRVRRARGIGPAAKRRSEVSPLGHSVSCHSAVGRTANSRRGMVWREKISEGQTIALAHLESPVRSRDVDRLSIRRRSSGDAETSQADERHQEAVIERGVAMTSARATRQRPDARLSSPPPIEPLSLRHPSATARSRRDERKHWGGDGQPGSSERAQPARPTARRRGRRTARSRSQRICQHAQEQPCARRPSRRAKTAAEAERDDRPSSRSSAHTDAPGVAAKRQLPRGLEP